LGAFEYVALDQKGRERKGVMEGDTARQVRQQLREKQLTPLKVEAVAEKESRTARGFQFRRGVSATDLALITRQLATLVRSGLPLEEALRTVSRQTGKPRLESMLLGVRARVLEGHALAQGLADFPHVFPELYRATVAAGEQSGHLDAVLERLADYTESRQQLRQKIQFALIYPILLTVMAVAVAALLLTYVVPQVVQVFENIGQELPPLTRGLIAVSEFTQAWGWLLALGLAGGAVAFVLAMRREAFRWQVHRLLLRVPLVSKLVRGVNTARFARTFSILASSGVPVLEAMRISAQVMSNLPMREAVTEAARRVREGASIKAALEKGGLFPPMMLHLIASGEASGRLEEMLERAAVSQEREVEALVASLLAMLEPLLIVGMGVMVLVIVLAILLPIFDLNQLVR